MGFAAWHSVECADASLLRQARTGFPAPGKLYGRTAFMLGAAQPQPANWRITCPIFPGFVCAIFSVPADKHLKRARRAIVSKCAVKTNARYRAFCGKARRRMQHPSPSKQQYASAVCRKPHRAARRSFRSFPVRPFTACARRGGAPLRCAGSSPRTQGNRPFPSTRSRRECRSAS